MPIELSFEFFPPKNAEAENKMWQAIGELAELKPNFISVTYGAGGTTRDYTCDIAKRIAAETSINTAAHLTCVGATRAEIDTIARNYIAAGVNHIVALRGDPPKEANGEYIPNKDGYAYATDLMRGLKEIGDFEFTVAAFPEKHPESHSFEQDIEVLKSKEDLGAARAITQYFFKDEYYLRLRDRADKAGIKMPIIPGIIPIGNFAQLKKFSAMCKTSIPTGLDEKFTPLDDNHDERDKAAIEFATEQCLDLRKEGVNIFHFYTMNRSDLIKQIYNNLG